MWSSCTDDRQGLDGRGARKEKEYVALGGSRGAPDPGGRKRRGGEEGRRGEVEGEGKGRVEGGREGEVRGRKGGGGVKSERIHDYGVAETKLQ